MPNIIEITDIHAPELAIYAGLNETQLLHYYEPDGGLFIAESPRIIERALDAGYKPHSFVVEKRYVDGYASDLIKRLGDIPIYVAELDVLMQMTGFNLTRGALCAMHRKPLPSVAEVCRGARRILVLEHVENPTNVGAMFRSAAALNMDAILLTDPGSDPLYRRASRVSMGTVFQIPWTFLRKDTMDIDFDRFRDADGKVIWERPSRAASTPKMKLTPYWPEGGMEALHALGFKTVSMALREDSYSIDDPALRAAEKLAVIMGTENDGLMPETIEASDYTVMIPMAHGVDSLNVAAAAAVACWELGKRE